MFLVLWDVDHTLVHTPKVGVHLYQLVFAELYGVELPDTAARANMAGRTDRAIVLDVLELAGIADPAAEVSRFEAALARLAPSTTGMVTELGRALPGAVQALAALHKLAAQGVRQSLLTGNIRVMAEVKLAPFGLTEYLDLDVGAYGNESDIRADLVGQARERAGAAYGTDYSGESTVLIGDTPLDIEAALAVGARGVGVATGRFTMDELTAAGAHAVLPDLSDTGSALAAVLGPASLGAYSRYQPRSA